MKDLKMSLENAQWEIKNGDLQTVTKTDQIIQRIWAIINLQKGNFKLEPDAGFDRYSILGQEPNNVDIQSVLSNTITSQYPEVLRVDVEKNSFDRLERVYNVTIKVTMKDGQQLETGGVVNA